MSLGGQFLMSSDNRRIARLEANAKRNSFKRINDLLKCFSRTLIFEDDNARRLLMDKLQAAKSTWQEHAR